MSTTTYTPSTIGYGINRMKKGQPFNHESGIVGYHPETLRPLFLKESGGAERRAQEMADLVGDLPTAPQEAK
ncbi:hypothetical protein [Arthrobacter sp. BF1]|uniref:hypothetical protein n=1 Tax=Arthrobacter sp. BF1 TaxID=2821145 RepID=UPI001C4FD8B6|nr:hypothetical protein [Arthrobacter sp. BF1]